MSGLEGADQEAHKKRALKGRRKTKEDNKQEDERKSMRKGWETFTTLMRLTALPRVRS